MPYIERDENGAIKGLFANAQQGYAEEWLSDDASEVLAFLSPRVFPDRIAKNAIWERASEQEAEVMEAMLKQQHIRIRRIYEGATHISTDHELFTLLSGALVQAFGEERAAELLAPTD